VGPLVPRPEFESSIRLDSDEVAEAIMLVERLGQIAQRAAAPVRGGSCPGLLIQS
jgi:hypothetical protein